MPERGPVTNFEIYAMPENRGQVIVSFADKEHSIGIMTLNPGQELPVHTRPVEEQLVQLAGVTRLDFYDGDIVIEQILLHPNEATVVPANRFHSHVNPSSTELSLIMSRFDGDFSGVMDLIRQNRRIG